MNSADTRNRKFNLTNVSAGLALVFFVAGFSYQAATYWLTPAHDKHFGSNDSRLDITIWHFQYGPRDPVELGDEYCADYALAHSKPERLEGKPRLANSAARHSEHACLCVPFPIYELSAFLVSSIAALQRR